MGVYKQVLKRNFILMVIANLICGTIHMAINTNLAAYLVNEVGLTQAQFGTVGSVGGIVGMILYPLIGVFCDKFRHGVCGAIGAAILMIISFMYLQVDSFGMAVLCKCIQTAGFAFVINACLSISASSVKHELRSSAMTLYGLGSALSYFTGPQTGTKLSTALGYPTMFKVCAVIAVVGIVVFLLNTSKPQKEENVPKKKMFGIEKSALPALFLSFTILQIVFIGQSYVTISLLERGIARAALFWSIGAVVNLVFRMFMTRIINKIGINKSFYFTVSLLAVAIICIAFANNFVLVILAAVCWGIGYNGTQACNMSLAVLRAPAERVGQASATHQVGHDLGMVVWLQVAGILVLQCLERNCGDGGPSFYHQQRLCPCGQQFKGTRAQ